MKSSAKFKNLSLENNIEILLKFSKDLMWVEKGETFHGDLGIGKLISCNQLRDCNLQDDFQTVAVFLFTKLELINSIN